jgi:hypothetical protein
MYLRAGDTSPVEIEDPKRTKLTIIVANLRANTSRPIRTLELD